MVDLIGPGGVMRAAYNTQEFSVVIYRTRVSEKGSYDTDCEKPQNKNTFSNFENENIRVNLEI